MGNHKKRINVVYSTDKDFEYEMDGVEEPEQIPNGQQKLKVSLDRKSRGGKEVTLITGFIGPQQELEKIGKELKTKCGVGGAIKDGEILLQGNHCEKTLKFLIDKGFTQTKKSGG